MATSRSFLFGKWGAAGPRGVSDIFSAEYSASAVRLWFLLAFSNILSSVLAPLALGDIILHFPFFVNYKEMKLLEIKSNKYRTK